MNKIRTTDQAQLFVWSDIDPRPPDISDPHEARIQLGRDRLSLSSALHNVVHAVLYKPRTNAVTLYR